MNYISQLQFTTPVRLFYKHYEYVSMGVICTGYDSVVYIYLYLGRLVLLQKIEFTKHQEYHMDARKHLIRAFLVPSWWWDPSAVI